VVRRQDLHLEELSAEPRKSTGRNNPRDCAKETTGHQTTVVLCCVPMNDPARLEDSRQQPHSPGSA
jgi:hypothetical protein